MNSEEHIFDECAPETEFTTQWFLVDPYGDIVNTVPPTRDTNAPGFGEVRYMMSDDLPDLPDNTVYIGQNISTLNRAAKALSLRIKKPRR